MGIMGFDYVEGVECPDAFPEEQPNAMELLANGEESILDEDTAILSLRDCLEAGAVDYTDIDVLEDFHGEELTFEGESSVTNNEDRNAEMIAPPPAVPLSEPGPSGLNQSNRASRVTRPHRRRVSTQLENARSDFATLTERQVSCMEMFARSVEKMAENDRQRNENHRERNEKFKKKYYKL